MAEKILQALPEALAKNFEDISGQKTRFWDVVVFRDSPIKSQLPNTPGTTVHIQHLLIVNWDFWI